MKNMAGSEKHRLREEIKRLRDALPEDWRRMASLAIADRLVSSSWYAGAGNILVYSAIKSEVDLSPFCARARGDGKRLFFPKVQATDMEFFQVDSEGQLCRGVFGVLELRTSGEECLNPNCVDGKCAGEIWDAAGSEETGHGRKIPILVPGVAFSRAGARIGYGKGYYDRYLARHGELLPIGICFGAQLADFVPEPCDRAMSWIVTERETFCCEDCDA